MSSSVKSNKKAARRRARLWEDSIVMAIRDLQWLEVMRRNPAAKVEGEPKNFGEHKGLRITRTPDGMIKLDGRAESALGDLGFAAGERLYLIEVKPTPKQFQDEWWRDGEINPKPLYSSLAKLTAKLNAWGSEGPSGIVPNRTGQDAHSNEAVRRYLPLSLRGHFLAFWSEQTADGGDQAADRGSDYISVWPYITGMNTSVSLVHDSERLIRRLKFRIGIHTSLEGGMGTVPLPALWEASATVNMMFQKSEDVKSIEELGSLGLTPDEFKAYVQWLVEQASDGEQTDEPINAIVLSTEGTFFHWVGTTGDLARVLTHRFDLQVPAPRPPAPSEGLTPKRDRPTRDQKIDFS
ncbi:hypothetical protein [Dyella sp. GSA-30]|uniref:hypothetical protein n=1 Tax=Dyella sp. GSA-30 TaxID=2994496 RepID=UPI00249371E0|nr:hypothetical protein [Dyella sp. GSA-30]BDU22933.1 hypothetical protein DYGSA30_43900 [Dyella sp. GSA-30]